MQNMGDLNPHGRVSAQGVQKGHNGQNRQGQPENNNFIYNVSPSSHKSWNS